MAAGRRCMQESRDPPPASRPRHGESISFKPHMNLYRMLQQRAAQGKPLRVGLIGAGKFGSMYLAQARHTPGIHMVAIADLSRERALAALARTGWEPGLTEAG